MSKIIITVIIPVYKAAATIERCARSLFEQTMTEEVEFLFVNDGTPDDSVNILQKVITDYSQLKEQIRIIDNTQNLGVSETRKRGIKEAHGEYIAWVDSDDWIERDMLESMWNATQNGIIDIVVQNAFVDTYEHDRLRDTREWELHSITNPKQALMNYHTDKYVPWGLPFQMSRRLLLLEAIERVHNVNITEDAIALIYLFAKANSCVWLEKAFYHYVCLNNGASLTSRNYQTKEEWDKQVLNINDVTEYLLSLDKKGYRVTANYIKWFWKYKFQAAFDSSWQFWKTYRECYRDAVLFDKTGIDTLQHKIKVWLKYNFYPIYWYKEGRFLFSK